MVQSVDAIYEGGVLRPLSDLALSEKQRVRLLVESAEEPAAKSAAQRDPLSDLRCDMGIADLAENLDDYRFGQRQP
ncbi:MAG TPA: antitoxin family protein [Lacipirellulaceae bacterium]|nr:antitoxin family protein [Lacipirellulaceae bacterium]